MKNLLLEYMKIIGYTVTGLVFAYVSFYLILNLYHSMELSRKISINLDEDSTYSNVINKIDKVTENISNFNSGDYHGNIPVGDLLTLKGKLEICTRQFKNDTFIQLKDKSELGIKDIYSFATSFQGFVLNGCLIQQFYDLSVEKEDGSLPIESIRNFAPFLKTDIELMIASSENTISNINYNNIYYFTTDHTNDTLFNKSAHNFYKTLTYYDKAADMALELSNWFQNEVSR